MPPADPGAGCMAVSTTSDFVIGASMTSATVWTSPSSAGCLVDSALAVAYDAYPAYPSRIALAPVIGARLADCRATDGHRDDRRASQGLGLQRGGSRERRRPEREGPALREADPRVS